MKGKLIFKDTKKKYGGKWIDIYHNGKAIGYYFKRDGGWEVTLHIPDHSSGKFLSERQARLFVKETVQNFETSKDNLTLRQVIDQVQEEVEGIGIFSGITKINKSALMYQLEKYGVLDRVLEA